MGWISGIAVYGLIWWTVLFAVLPWGAQPPDEPAQGTAASAPERPRLLLKFAVTTLIAGVIWLVLDAVLASGWITFGEQPR